MKQLLLLSFVIVQNICFSQTPTLPSQQEMAKQGYHVENPLLLIENESERQDINKGITKYFDGPGNPNNSMFSSLHTRKNPSLENRLLFKNWAKGKIVNHMGKTIANDTFLFNYDKVDGSILLTLTTNKRAIIELYKQQIQSCELTDGANTYTFVNVEGIGNGEFCLVVAGINKKYTLYKKIDIELKKANYIDKLAYYIFSSTSKQLNKIDFKETSLKKVFTQDQSKTDAYFSGHPDLAIDEKFVIGLVDSLNR